MMEKRRYQKSFTLIFLAIWCLLSLTMSVRGGTLSGTARSDLDARDLASLKEFLQHHMVYSYDYDTKQRVAFDYRNPMKDMIAIRTGLPGASADEIYPGETGGYYIGNDPLGRMPDARVFQVEKLNWILKNIYHCTDVQLEQLWAAAVSDTGPYVYDGYYYRGGDDTPSCQAVDLQELRFDGEHYYAYFYQYSPVMYSGFDTGNYAVLGYELIDGEKYWTLYYSSKDERGDLWNPAAQLIDTRMDTYYYSALVTAQDGGAALMDEDSAYAASLAFVPDRTRLEMTDMVYNKDEGQFFGKTEYNGKTGWVSLSKVLLLTSPSFWAQVDSQAYYIDLLSANVREGGVLGQIPNGTTLYISALLDGDKAYTTYNGISGKIDLHQLKLLKTDEVTANAADTEDIWVWEETAETDPDTGYQDIWPEVDNSQVSIEEVIPIEGPGDLWDEYDSNDHN